MKRDQYWKKLFIAMLCLLFGPIIIMSCLKMDVTFAIMYACAAGIIVCMILLGIKYVKGEYTGKEYTARVLSLALPYLPFPLYTFVRVWLYYAVTQDSDPLGFLWVFEVIPQTVLFAVAAGLTIMITFMVGVRQNKDKEGSGCSEQ